MAIKNVTWQVTEAGKRIGWDKAQYMGTLPIEVWSEAVAITDKKERNAFLLNWFNANPECVTVQNTTA